MEERVKKIIINYDLINGKDAREGYCTFCGRPKQVSDYAAGQYIVQFCSSCIENLPGVVKAEVIEKKLEFKKKKQ